MSLPFDPNAASLPDSGIFGLPHGPDEARVHVIPVPFDATTSYRKGAAGGPEAVLRASRQVDLHDAMFGRTWEHGIAWIEPDPRIAAWNAEANALAAPIIERGGIIGDDPELRRALDRVNAIGAELNRVVHDACFRAMNAGKMVALLGGDHAVPYGAWHAAALRHPGMGLLHFDAHCDLREAYEGFRWSHASILYNALEGIPDIEALVQVGIRDVSEGELEYARKAGRRAHVLFDHEWAFARLEGGNLRSRVRDALTLLPRDLWITFDVDALDPALCPNTGTPVPGGLSWPEAMLWLDELAHSDHRILGVDLVEVSPGAAGDDEDSYDAVVGARLLYRLIGAALTSLAKD